MQHLDRRIGFEKDLFPQIDLRVAAFSQQAEKLIVAKALTAIIGHSRSTSCEMLVYLRTSVVDYSERRSGCQANRLEEQAFSAGAHRLQGCQHQRRDLSRDSGPFLI